MSSTGKQSADTAPNNRTKDNTIGMLMMGGMVLSAAGFVLYTRRTESMLRQMNHIAEGRAKRVPPRKPGPMTKEEWDKIRPRFEKDDFF